MGEQRYNVSHTEMSTLPYIIAVDFDGTLVEDNFPNIGMIRPEVWVQMETAIQNGAKMILWTCRDGKNLTEAVEFCRSMGVEFDAVNENLSEVQAMFNNDTRKVYANEYWDDKAVSAYSRIRLSAARGDGSMLVGRCV